MATQFDSTKESLSDLLKAIDDGTIALPDFQRDWRWDDDHIASLLASITQGFPIGTVMTLATGNPDVRFKARPVAGAPTLGDEPDWLILDGQQRMTSLYRVLKSNTPVATRDRRKKPVDRWYFIRIDTALDKDADYEEAIVSMPAEKITKAFGGAVNIDVTSAEREWDQGLFPFSVLLDTTALHRWQMGFINARGQDGVSPQLETWNAFHEEVVQSFSSYQIPIIKLAKTTPKEAVCRVFEKVNTGGVPLDVFELVTATFAAEDFDLRADWDLRRSRFAENHYLRSILGGIQSTDFLQAISLVASWHTREQRKLDAVAGERLPAVTCKRRDILKLESDTYVTHADSVTAGFIEAAHLFHQHKLYTDRDVPYRTQIIPMAATFALLGNAAKTDTARQKLSRWFWCGVFGELYGSTTETRFANDVEDLADWLREGETLPSTIRDATFAASRLLTLRTRNSAAYKGLHALLMLDGCLDFLEGKPIELTTYTDGDIDIHHIFPQKWYRDNGVEDARGNSIVNKTPLTARTNRIIGGRAPSDYLVRLEKDSGIDPSRMDKLLKSHAIDPTSLRSDDFDQFFSRRAKLLVERIEAASGITVLRDLDDVLEDDLIDYEGTQNFDSLAPLVEHRRPPDLRDYAVQVAERHRLLPLEARHLVDACTTAAESFSRLGTNDIDAHVEALEAASQYYPYINLGLGREIAATLKELIETNTKDGGLKGLLSGAVSYFVLSGDPDDDFASVSGLEDDARVVNAVAREMGRADLVVEL